MNSLTLYLNTSEKEYDEDNTTVFFLTQDKDFTDCARTTRTWREKRFETRFEAALVNIGEAIHYIAEFKQRLSRDERDDIIASIHLRNDVQNGIWTGEHFDIYEMIKFLPAYKTKQAHILLNYGVKIKWFDKIVALARQNWIKFYIANTVLESYKEDKAKLDNYRKENERALQRREVRERKGKEFVFRHLKSEGEKEND